MKSYKRDLVRDELKRLGFSQVKGKASGHEYWQDQNGKRCRPVFRHRDVSHGILYSLGCELESKGIRDRQSFINQIKLNHRR